MPNPPETLIYTSTDAAALVFTIHGFETEDDLATIGRDADDIRDVHSHPITDHETFDELKVLHAFLEGGGHRNEWWWLSDAMTNEAMHALWRTNERWVRDPRMEARFGRYTWVVKGDPTFDPAVISATKSTYTKLVKSYKPYRKKLKKWTKGRAEKDVYFVSDLNFLRGHHKIACFAPPPREWDRIEIIKKEGNLCCALMMKDGTHFAFSVRKEKERIGQLFLFKQVKLAKAALCGIIGTKNEAKWDKFLKKRVNERELQGIIEEDVGMRTLVRQRFRKWDKRQKPTVGPVDHQQ